MLLHERNDFKTLTPTEILKRIIVHEMALDDKEEVLASHSHIKKSVALKANIATKGDSSDEEEEKDLSEHEIALFVKKFSKMFKKGNNNKYLDNTRKPKYSSDMKKKLN